jgi:transposase
MKAESRELALLYKDEKDVRLKERYHALFVLSKGVSVKQVAEYFLRDEDTIRNWIKQWKTKRSVEDSQRSGRPPEINPELEKKIVKIVDENNPKKYGLNVSNWDCRELQLWLAFKNKYVSLESIRQVLTRNRFRYVKPNHDFVLANKKQKAGFISGFKRVLKLKKGIIMFADTTTHSLHPKKGYYWTREKKPTISTHCSHKKAHVTGAVSLNGKLITRTSKKINANAFLQFLKKLLKHIKQHILLYLDNFPAHKTKKVQKFIKQHKRIKLYWFPKYSPKLNPIENLWKHAKQKKTNNQEFSNQKSLMKTLEHYYQQIPQHTIKQTCSTNCIINPG